MYITNRSFSPFSSYVQNNVNEANNTEKETQSIYPFDITQEQDIEYSNETEDDGFFEEEVNHSAENNSVRAEILDFMEDMEARADFEAGTNCEPTSRVGNWLLNAAAVASLPITLTFQFVEKHPVASMLAVLAAQIVGIATAAGAQLNATEAPTSSSRRTNTSSALHSKTMDMASTAIREGEKHFTTVASFKNRECTEQAKVTTFGNSTINVNGTQDGSIKWERCLDGDNNCGMIANLTKPQFYRAVGYAAGSGRNCVTALSVDPICLTETKNNIHQQAVKREMLAALSPEKNQNTTCLTKPTYKGAILSNTGQKVPIFQEMECRRAKVTYKEPAPEVVQSYLGKLASALCINRLAVISDGIEGNDVVSSVMTTSAFLEEPVVGENGISSMETINGSLPSLAPTIGSKFARSALTPCHNIKLDDVRGMQNITTTRNGIQHSTSALSLTSVIQSLSQILDMESNGLPTAVTLLDIHEIANYHPDVMLVEALVSKLKEQGVEVYAYASSAGSWLSRIQGVKATKEVSEILSKKVKIKRSPAPQSLGPDTKAGDHTDDLPRSSVLPPLGLVTFSAILSGLGLLYWCKKDRSPSAREGVAPMPPESIPLRMLNQHAEELDQELSDEEYEPELEPLTNSDEETYQKQA